MRRTKTTGTIRGELALIESIRRKAAQTPDSTLRLGIGDDCAVLRQRPGYEICITTDFSLEGRHFRREWHPPQSAGHRCLARGLSDLAAMGAEPIAAFLSLTVPAHTPAAWVDCFMDGLLALARKYRVPLAGGDTAQSPSLIAADIVAVGQFPAGSARLRSGARPGDALYVTGSLGGAAAELAMLAQNPARFRNMTRTVKGHPHLYPEPRLAAGQRLRKIAMAMIDISDGLSTDLTHLCKASGVAAEIDQAALPIHPLAIAAEREKRIPSALDLALNGGEDYELLFTASSTTRVPHSIAATPIHRIGTIRKAQGQGPQITMRTLDGRTTPIKQSGWEHFR